MESRSKMGIHGIASTRSGGGVGLRGDGVQLLGYRDLLTVALLFVTAITFVIKDVHCSVTTDAVAPAPTPSTQQTEFIVTFKEFEANALNAVFQKWSKQNPQLSTLLNWSLDKHPCSNLTDAFQKTTGNYFQGAWSGVGCTSVLQNRTENNHHYHVIITSFWIYGSNFGCVNSYDPIQCGFDGIIGHLPPEISNLTNLQLLSIKHNPRLTGPVPVELFQMPNLTDLYLTNNSLSGTLPSDVDNANCKLEWIELDNNNFSGNLRLSSQGTLFCLSLLYLDLNNNSLSRAFSSNVYNPDFQLQYLYLSYNNFSGSLQLSSHGTLFCPSLSTLSISNNNFYGPFPEELLQIPYLSSLDVSMNNFSGLIDFESFNLTTFLDDLNISNNNLNGTFSIGGNLDPRILDISKNQFSDIKFQAYNKTTPSNGNIFLPSLEKIHFQNNNFSGQFPKDILTAPNLQILDASHNEYQTLELPSLPLETSNLSQVFITNNKLDSVHYPNKGRLSPYNLQLSSILFLGGNPICDKIENPTLSSICRRNGTEELQPVIPKSNTKMKIIIATSTSTTLLLLLLITAIYVWRLMGRIKALRTILEEFAKKEVKPNLYSYKEVKLATNNFDKDNKLGEGGFGVVYKGKLSDGTQAAVKKLTTASNQVLSEFLNEVVVISGLKHCNLVKLKGCCLGDGDQRILVFEYVENNNLAEALWTHGDLQRNIGSPCLDWETRFNIIVGIAKGLAYLHEELQPPIIHRDIKATNILLDKNYNAKIADFGLAYLFPTLDNEASHLTFTQIAGTRGYCAPEYVFHGHVSTTLDVYSFGILVLEIVSGRKNIDLQKPSEEIDLREWAWKQYKAKASMMLIDHKMEHNSTDLEVILRVLVVGLACVDSKATRRPKMHDVVPMLLGNMSINQFRVSFEDRDKIAEMSAGFLVTSGTISSLWINDNLHRSDDCALLSNIGDLEMNLIVT